MTTPLRSTAPPASPPRRPAARRTGPLLLVLIALAVLVAGCGSGPGTREEFIDILTRNPNLTTEEATCISDAVFARYGADEEALGKISAAPDFEYLRGEEGVPGFAEFYDDTVLSCSQVGPTSS